MIFDTRRFGSLEIEEKQVINIIGGLLGFEQHTRYVVLDHDKETPFKWLQSLEDPDLAFVVMEPFVFYPNYEFELPDKDIHDLEIAGVEDVRVLSILVVPDDIRKITANLKAPLVINVIKQKGKQVILTNDTYPVKYYLFNDKNQGGQKYVGINQESR